MNDGIALAGNRFEDHILYCDDFKVGNSNLSKKYKTSLGGIWNTWYWLMKKKGVFPKLFQDVKNPAEAFIFIDGYKKTSVVNWGRSEKYNGKEIIKWYKDNKVAWPKIVHFSYLDSLPELDVNVLKELKRNKAKLSCDFCKSYHEDWYEKKFQKLLPYFDYFFVSENEWISPKLILDYNEKAQIFFHTPDYSEYITKIQKIKYLTPRSLRSPSHLVGAGDIFAGKVIFDLYKNDLKINDPNSLMENAHKECYNYIKEKI